jgi:hypothetical protein
MLKARPETLSYLRGLNGEFRGLEAIFTAPEPKEPVACTPAGEVETFERTYKGHRFIFAVRAPGRREAATVQFNLPTDSTGDAIQVHFESRRLNVVGHSFSDRFQGATSVHVYEF